MSWRRIFGAYALICLAFVILAAVVVSWAVAAVVTAQAVLQIIPAAWMARRNSALGGDGR